jgi:hypothetical protein
MIGLLPATSASYPRFVQLMAGRACRFPIVRDVHIQWKSALTGAVATIVGAGITAGAMVLTSTTTAPAPQVRVARPEKMEDLLRKSPFVIVTENLPAGSHLWLATRNTTSNSYYYVKPDRAENDLLKGWVCLGTEKQPNTEHYEIVPILLPDAVNDQLAGTKKVTPGYHTEGLIGGAKPFATVMVQRSADAGVQLC